jgi:uncharacterized delta-60 repeat protein
MPLLLLFLTTAVTRGQSALDGFDPNANGAVFATVVQPDGKILIRGLFTTLSPNGGPPVTRNHIARLNPDGTVDALFDPNPTGDVSSIVVQADGKILVGGSFTSIGGQARNRIARLDATTGAADSFDPNANGNIGSIAVQADGKILAAGGFTSIGGQVRNHIARLDPTTGLADSFDPNADQNVSPIVVQADGKILAVGSFTTIGGQTRNKIARLDPITGLADSFDPNCSLGYISAIALQADGKVLVGGYIPDFGTPNIGGQVRNNMARLDAVTGLADSFNPNPNGPVQSIAVQTDGKILVGGYLQFVGGQARAHIARLDPTTGMADSFNPTLNDDIVQSIAVQADGKILAGGYFTTAAPNGGAPVPRNHIARLETDGRLDQTLNLNIVANPFEAILATAVQPDGKTLIGGQFSNVLGVTRNNIARLNNDGTLDATFNPNANSIVTSIVVQTGGKILVGGYFHGTNSIGGQTRNYIARLDATSGLADSFDPNSTDVGGYILSIVVQLDGKILVGGGFGNIGGQPRERIARLDPSTGFADSFDPQPHGIVHCMALQTDGKILVGGEFHGANSIGGQTRNYIARLDPTTALADSFDPNASNNVNSIVVQPDGKIVVGGYFAAFNGMNSIGGQPRNYIARVDETTGLADSFDPNANGSVISIAPQADGKIVVGGAFTSIGGQQRGRVARLSSTGSTDSFNPNVELSDSYVKDVYSIAAQADGKILAGGQFERIGGQARYHFARLSNDIAAQQNLSVTQTTITWTRDGSSSQLTRTVFEYSSDNVSFTSLGNGAAIGSNWTLTGLSLPTHQNFYIRARGYYRSGYFNGSESITEVVRTFFLVPPVITSPDNATFTVGAAGTFTVTATGSLTGSSMLIAETGALPGGVTFVNNNNGTATLAGTPNPGTAGIYPITITANNGVSPNASQNFTLTVNQSPAITSANNITFTTSAPGTFTVTTTGFPTGASMAITESGPLPAGVTFTNNNNGTATLAGTAAAGAAGTYPLTLTANNGVAPNATQNFTLTVMTPAPTPGTLGNISTRLRVLSGDNALIGGMIATGTAPKRVIIRAIGPSLTGFGVPGALENPTLELFQGSTLLFSNDDWNNSTQQAEIANSGLAPSNNLESAIIWTLTPGQGYTAVVRGKDGTTGVGVVEAFDLDQAAGSKLGNISTRGFVDVDDNVMIAGLIVSPSNGTSTKVLVRALGPTLGDFGVPNALTNPTLDLVNSSGTVVRSNDNWKDDAQQRALIEAANLTPSHDEEAALVETVAPGAYTAIVRGNNRTTGVGLVEAYNIP